MRRAWRTNERPGTARGRWLAWSVLLLAAVCPRGTDANRADVASPAVRPPDRDALTLEFEPDAKGPSWPWPCGLELPRGALPRGHSFVARSPGGQEVPCAITRRRVWPNGDARWIQLRWGGAGDVRRVRLRPTTRLARSRLTVEADLHDSGTLRGPKGTLHWTSGSVRYGTRDACFIDFAGTEWTVDGVAARWDDATVRLSGPDAAGASLTWSAAIHSAAGAELPLRVGVHLALNDDASAARWSWWCEADAPLVLRRVQVPMRLPSGSHLHGTRLRDVTTVDAGRDATAAECSASVGRPGGVQLLWPSMDQRRPARMSVDAHGFGSLGLVSEPVALEAGQRVTRTFHLHDKTPVVAAWAVEPDTSARLDKDDLAWLDAWLLWLDAWSQRPSSIETHGSYPGRYDRCANGEYDLAGSLLALASSLPAGDSRRAALRVGTRLVAHQLDWLRAVDPPSGWPQGLFWMHGSRAHSNKLEMGHVWIEGLLGRFRVQGEDRSFHAAQQVLQALDAMAGTPTAWKGPERRLAWPLWAAAVGHSLDPGGMARIRQIAERLLGRQHREGWIQGDTRPRPSAPGSPEVSQWCNLWVSLGITAPALHRASSVAGRDDWKEAAQRLSQWSAAAAIRPEGITSVVELDPTTGDEVARGGRCRDGDLALASLRLAEGRALRDPDVWSAARASLSTPRSRDLTAFAKALFALRLTLDSAASTTRDTP